MMINVPTINTKGINHDYQHIEMYNSEFEISYAQDVSEKPWKGIHRFLLLRPFLCCCSCSKSLTKAWGQVC